MNTEQIESVEEQTYRLHRRFDRMGRLVGDRAMERLFQSHVLVIGLGGVGSWAAEALARSGVGRLTLVDFDEICITNANRQLHALAGLVGQKKAHVMAERCQRINPQARVEGIPEFYNARTSDALLSSNPDVIIDAIDNLTAKCHLIDRCIREGRTLVTSTGSGGRLDPTQVRVMDLGETEIDPLARSVRRILRQEYGYPETRRFGVRAVCTSEPARDPLELHYDGGKGFRCVCPQGQNDLHSCDQRSMIFGNAGFVTGAFGLACAAEAVRTLTLESAPTSQ